MLLAQCVVCAALVAMSHYTDAELLAAVKKIRGSVRCIMGGDCLNALAMGNESEGGRKVSIASALEHQQLGFLEHCKHFACVIRLPEAVRKFGADAKCCAEVHKLLCKGRGKTHDVRLYLAARAYAEDAGLLSAYHPRPSRVRGLDNSAESRAARINAKADYAEAEATAAARSVIDGPMAAFQGAQASRFVAALRQYQEQKALAALPAPDTVLLLEYPGYGSAGGAGVQDGEETDTEEDEEEALPPGQQPGPEDAKVVNMYAPMGSGFDADTKYYNLGESSGADEWSDDDERYKEDPEGDDAIYNNRQ